MGVTQRVKIFIVFPGVPTQKSYRAYGQIAKVANIYQHDADLRHVYEEHAGTYVDEALGFL